MPQNGTEKKENFGMALTNAQVKEILSKAGVDSEHMRDAVSEIIEGHAASIEALREKVASLEKSVKESGEENERLKESQAELEELRKQVEADAKAREGKDYDKLSEEFAAYKAEVAKKEARAAKEKAFRSILKDAEIDRKYFDKIMKYSDIDGIELDKEGNAKDSGNIIKAIREEWPEYKTTVQQRGAETPEPPANTGGGKSKAEILAIANDSERQQAIADNHELFGF